MKIFKLKEGRYEKIFESDGGKFKFEIERPFEVDFDWIWRRS